MAPKSNDNLGGEKAGLDRLKMEAKRASGPFLLYTLLVLAGLITFAGIVRNLAGDKPWVHYTPYQVAFSDTKGVVPSRAELRLAGVKAGSVKKSSLDNGQAVLTLNLEKKYAPMYKDAVVRIRPITPLEDMYVDILSRGHKSAGKLGKNDILPSKQTISPVQIGNVLDTFNKGTRGNITTLLNELSVGLSDKGESLKWSFRQLSPFFINATKVLDALAARRDNFKRFITNFGSLAGKLGESDTQLANFVKHGDSVLGELNQNDAPFNATLAQLPGTLQVMQSSFTNLQRTQDVLDPALQSLKPVAKKLPGGLDGLDGLTSEANPAVTALRTPVKQLRPLATSLRPTARSLVGVFQKAVVQAPQLDKGVQMTVPCLPTIGQFMERAESATKLGDAIPDQPNTSSANFRADVHTDFSSFGEFTAEPTWKRFIPCHYLDKVKGGERLDNP